MILPNYYANACKENKLCLVLHPFFPVFLTWEDAGAKFFCGSESIFSPMMPFGALRFPQMTQQVTVIYLLHWTQLDPLSTSSRSYAGGKKNYSPFTQPSARALHLQFSFSFEPNCPLVLQNETGYTQHTEIAYTQARSLLLPHGHKRFTLEILYTCTCMKIVHGSFRITAHLGSAKKALLCCSKGED